MRAVRPVGTITRGTTHPQRLRRVDRWLLAHDAPLRASPSPLVVDLGFGALPRTTAEMFHRLRVRHPDVEVIGTEIDPVRVAAAQTWAEPGLSFRLGGFELDLGRGVSVVRAMNVLRQYDEADVPAAWARLGAALEPGGVVVEGTCDELGRLGSWVTLTPGGPVSLTFSAQLATLARPGEFAERLPKALIHQNVPGTAVHALLQAWDRTWAAAAAVSPFGPRARFVESVRRLREAGTPLLGRADRWRLGEVTVAWHAVAGPASR